MSWSDRPPMPAGHYPTSAEFETILDRIEFGATLVRKTSSETVNNTSTLQDDNELAWTVAANATYALELHVGYSTGATPDIKFGWTYPTGLTMQITGTIGYDAATLMAAPATFTQTSVLPAGGAASDLHFALWGLVFAGSASGTLQLQWAQNTANASDTIVRAGSYGVLTRHS